MTTPKSNPKRWYLLMLFCLTLSIVLFFVANKLAIPGQDTHAVAIMIGIWAPAFGIMGLRAELVDRKD